ncbi:MAG: Glycosyltransferase [Parcubacteria group bacterium GW2011_GWC2_42_12]|nr:MAG: Glycosyltransferase [Parcubacteria group bacterium GW2011_GWC2_42_12]KKT45190.1 MAG: Glycosyltransferase [Parcubacteria group bacterium GW2011_GWA2_44_15]
MRGQTVLTSKITNFSQLLINRVKFMKICLINNLYEPYARGGAEKITKIIANGLVKAGHEVFIITTSPYFKQLKITFAKDWRGQANCPPSLALRRTSELRIYYLNSLYHNLNKYPKVLRLVWHIWNMFNFINYFRIKKILKKAKCVAVVTNNLMGLGFLTPLAIRRLKIKHIHLVHDLQLIHPAGLLLFGQENMINGQWARNYAGLCSRLFASPKAVIFPSRWLRDRHLDKIFFIKSKRIVLPNPVAPALAVAALKDNEIFKFLYLGQIEKHKGLNLLIQAYKRIREKFPRTELIIAGVGSGLEQVKIEAGRDNSIKFLGRQDEAQVNKLLSVCQSLVVPTLCYENCPTVILEAFSAGLPVLAADLGGISELLGENTAGLLFRPGNVADLADKMSWAIECPSDLTELARVGKEKVKQYSVENYIKELEGLIN